MKKRLIVVAACLTTLAACSGTQGNTPVSSRELQAQGAAQAQAQDSRSENPLPESDPALVQKTAVLNELHHINQREIALAEIAKAKATTAAAERVADAVIATHEKLDARVETAAERAGVELGAYQAATHEQAVMDSLHDLNGKDFDRAFLENMKMSHENAAADLRRAKQSTKDPLLTRAINETLPELEKHKRQSRRAEQRVKNL
jgi:predicted outer membrane protein